MKKDSNRGHLIGIDEVGRGPLAGPVAVGAFGVKDRAILRKFRGVKDSKQLSETQREEWFKQVKVLAKSGEVAYAVSFASAKVIDTKGLSYAIRSCLTRSIKKVEKNGVEGVSGMILLDGSLYAPDKYPNQKTIIKGDAKEPIISLASVCAKVVRDRHLKKLAKMYPNHGFDIHKGYGTKAHYEAIKKYGMTPEHRRSFLKGLSI